MYDTIILGAGLSGLAAGIRLAYYDRKVCILERHTVVGGLNSYYRRGGRLFDVGLHAVTNYVPKGARLGPLVRILRQLRLPWEAFELSPQLGSRIAFPEVSLRFTNDPALLREEIRARFPGQVDGFDRLVAALPTYKDLGRPETRRSARAFVGEFLTDPLLAEMLFCPLLLYGAAREHDTDLGSFAVLFRSIYLEGFARPAAGVRPILDTLVRRFQELGGELRLGAGVRRLRIRESRVDRVVLDDGEELEAGTVLSSAGCRETLRLCDDQATQPPLPAAGRLSFVEAISVLDRQPRDLGLTDTIVFFNDSPHFDYARPAEPIDDRSGVVCSPNNFAYDAPLPEGLVRLTMIANHESWASMPPPIYCLEKRRCYATMMASAVRFVPDFRWAVVASDVFTPTTIQRFTGKDEGAVYGAPEKRHDGATHVANLFLCGTDQGMVGIVGTILSGITVANAHALKNS
jgi:phytoene dehydrogenase-like protein